MRLSLLDASTSTSAVQLWMRENTTVAEAESAAPMLIDPVAALSDASIQSWHVVYRGNEDPRPSAPGTAPTAGAGVFVFSCDAPSSYVVVIVPAIRSDLLLPAGPGASILIDLAAAEVIAFADLMISGVYCNPFAVQVLALESAFYQWRP